MKTEIENSFFFISREICNKFAGACTELQYYCVDVIHTIAIVRFADIRQGVIIR